MGFFVFVGRNKANKLMLIPRAYVSGPTDTSNSQIPIVCQSSRRALYRGAPISTAHLNIPFSRSKDHLELFRDDFTKETKTNNEMFIFGFSCAMGSRVRAVPCRVLVCLLWVSVVVSVNDRIT